MYFNEKLADERGLSDCHRGLLDDAYSKLEGLLKEPEKYAETGAQAVEMCAAYEYVLQYLWGFDLNSNFHRYDFRIKGCLCPGLDNEELVGTAVRCFTTDCPFHGEKKYEKLIPEKSIS